MQIICKSHTWPAYIPRACHFSFFSPLPRLQPLGNPKGNWGALIPPWLGALDGALARVELTNLRQVSDRYLGHRFRSERAQLLQWQPLQSKCQEGFVYA